MNVGRYICLDYHLAGVRRIEVVVLGNVKFQDEQHSTNAEI